MKDLTYTQAKNCELAVGKVCKCRCGGLLHGALRASIEELSDKGFYNTLNEYDPHHIDTMEQREQKKAKRLARLEDVLSLRLHYVGQFHVKQVFNETKEALFECMYCGAVRKDLVANVLVNNTYKQPLHTCSVISRITTEYDAYRSMLVRCYDTDHYLYKQFGALGIRVEPRWLEDFFNFLYDMGLKPSSDCLLARRDKTKNYGQANTVWALENKIVKGLPAMALHTMYEFGAEWFTFWLVEYDYGRASKVIRTEEYQAPLTKLEGDTTFSVIRECPSELVEKWLEKFGEKFGYTGCKRVDNGKAQYLTIFPDGTQTLESTNDPFEPSTSSTSV